MRTTYARQLAQKIKYTYEIEEFIKNVPLKGTPSKDIKGTLKHPQNLRWCHNNEIIKKVGKYSLADHNILWTRGKNWEAVVEQLSKFER